MTPTELQALLDREGVPMEARASVTLNGWGDLWEHRGPHRVDDDLGELAHVGAMVRWLADQGVAPEIERYNILNGSKCYCVSYYDHKYCERAEFDDAPTLTEALAHACGQVAKEKPNA